MPTPLRRVGSLLISLSAVVALASCGGGNDSATLSAEDSEFCLLALELVNRSSVAHSPDPTQMEKDWADIVSLYSKMADAAPESISKEARRLADDWATRQKIFARFNYNVAEMASVPEVEKELTELSSNKDFVAANEKIRDFMVDKCGISES